VGKITATEIVINTNEFRKKPIQENMHVMQVLALEHPSKTSIRGKARKNKKNMLNS